MLYRNVCCGAVPEAVVVEALPEGGRRIVMSRDFEEVPVDGEDAGTTWMGQQVCFVLDDGREDTVESISAAFEEWWAYGEDWKPETGKPTMEQRMADAEAAILALMGF